MPLLLADAGAIVIPPDVAVTLAAVFFVVMLALHVFDEEFPDE